MYKNKAKRIYLDGEYYFVTVKTFNNAKIFNNRYKAEIFFSSLIFLKQRGDFKLASGVLLPDHFHLLLSPIKKNISEIMHDLKSYSAQIINKYMQTRRGRDASPLINGMNYSNPNKPYLVDLSNQKNPSVPYKIVNPNRRGVSASPFSDNRIVNPNRRGVSASPLIKIWQRSFYYHIVTNDRDFENHYNYILWNPEKHRHITNSEKWPWLWCEDDIFEF